MWTSADQAQEDISTMKTIRELEERLEKAGNLDEKIGILNSITRLKEGLGK